jgi:serine/threonine-protein kinase ATR
MKAVSCANLDLQGKTLETPERVPFRLTQNMVDGFGVTGTEGMQ